MILLIDNYDSFTFNIAQYLAILKQEVIVKRNDEITIEYIVKLSPNYIILSPGPGTPDDAGITLDVIKCLSDKIPILGVCLGHQAIAQAFGANIIRATRPIHGKVSSIMHNAVGVFEGLPKPMNVTRYHSLIVEKSTLISDFEVTAWTEEQGHFSEIMAIKHKNLPLEGVQFHPESILSEHGLQIFANFLNANYLNQNR